MQLPYDPIPYDPWIGENYKPRAGFLILSESLYCLPDKDTGATHIPDRQYHPDVIVRIWGIQRFGSRGGYYSAKLTRTLCGVAYPSQLQRDKAWNEVALTSFVQRPMASIRQRPGPRDWSDGVAPFLQLLEELKPARVLVTGRQLWRNMPATQVQRGQYLQAYRCADGFLCWCLCVPHPSSRTLGDTYRWRTISTLISNFQARTDLEPA